MKLKIADLKLYISPKLLEDLPDWFSSKLEFEFPYRVRAGEIVERDILGEEAEVVVRLWESLLPSRTEKPTGEVSFFGRATNRYSDIRSESRILGR